MARRVDMEWRDSERFRTRKLLWVVDDMGCWKWSGYTLRQLGRREWAVDHKNKEIGRWTSRTDARLYCEFRAEIDREELTSS